MKKIYRFNEFKLIREAEGDDDDDLFSFDEEDEETTTEDDSSDFDFGDDIEEDEESEQTEDEESEQTEEEEPEPEINYNEDPAYYVERSIKSIEQKIINLFENPLENTEDKVAETDPSSYYEQGVELIDVKSTDMPLNKTLIVKYGDNQYVYHLLFTVNIDQGLPKNDKEMSSDMIEECGVKFKKYDEENKLIGEIERKKVSISDINQDFIDTLNGELDQKYSVGNDEFEIEYDNNKE